MVSVGLAVLSSLPPRPVLYRFGDVRGLDRLAIREVGDGAREFEYAVKGAGRELQLVHRRFE